MVDIPVPASEEKPIVVYMGHGRCKSAKTIRNNDTIICEILSRLPVKFLMRLKCICKRWRSLIEEDAYFIKLHLNRSRARPALFITFRLHLERYILGCENWSLKAQLLDGIADIHTMRELGLHSYGQVLKPVNGLMCVVDKDNNAICVRNITTGEATSWIQTTIDVERTEGYKLLQKFKIYEFGCDPTTMEHKVICILSMCKTQSCTQYEVCEVLTVCDNTWTRINDVPGLPYDYNLKESVNVNGVIYWFTCKYLGNSNKHEYPSFILAFDVGKEKFRKITLPNSYLDKPCDHILYFCCSTLLQVDGHVALMRRQSDRTVKLWLLNDKNKESGTKSGTDTNWYADTITLPSDISWDEKSRPQFYSVEGTDRIIIETNKDYYRHVCHASLHSYNWKKRSFGEVKFNGMPYSVPCCSSINHFRTFSESLLPVQKKLRQSTTLQLG